MNSLLTDKSWFSHLGSHLEIVNEIDGVVYYKQPVWPDMIMTTLYINFTSFHYGISKEKKTLLVRLKKLSEYDILPYLMRNYDSPLEVDLLGSYIILGKRVFLNSLETMTDLEFEEIITTLTFTPDLL